ncbi:MAG: DUF3347 domain-containing protein, partial [Desulfobacterales bacterium]|nr:DUF3347 domain-containing protein [Desulfobacterales bacterium]
PSMMSPQGGVSPSGHGGHGVMVISKNETMGLQKHEETHKMKAGKKEPDAKWHSPVAFREQIDEVLTIYFKIQQALSQDKADRVRKEAGYLKKSLDAVDMELLNESAHKTWMRDRKDLTEQASALVGTSNIKKQRESFYLFSETLISVVKQFGAGGVSAVIQFHCPMAFGNRGADWLQNKPGVENPYFGKMMFSCGEQRAVLVPKQQPY